jgi:glycosyltransferase involved in cell wall biosynthesis
MPAWFIQEPNNSKHAMKSLYFAPHQLLPVNTGGRTRDYQLARQLAERSTVTFVEMRHVGEEPSLAPAHSGLVRVVSLQKDRTYSPTKILRGLAGPTPVTLLNCWSTRSASQLAHLLRSSQFDTLQMEGVHLMNYLPIIQKAPRSPAIVVDWHNIESELMYRYAETAGNRAKTLAARRTAKLIERAEDRLLEVCATHTVSSERELQKLLARCPGANIQVIPNGVDTGYFSAEKIMETVRQARENHSKPAVLFVGSMDYHANIDAVTWFAKTAWPEIARMHPDLQFKIVGRNPAREVRALASDRICVTGTVDDVRPFYANAIATVVPLRSGSGTRVKILEAMAAGVPVISTRLGAEGIDAEDGVHQLLADSCKEIAAALNRVASSIEMRNRLSQAGRALVCRIYDWSVIGTQLFRIHAQLVKSHAPGSLRKVS